MQATDTHQTPSSSDTLNGMWSINDVAAYFGRSRRTIARWLQQGRLPHHRLPSGQILFDPPCIRSLIERRERS